MNNFLLKNKFNDVLEFVFEGVKGVRFSFMYFDNEELEQYYYLLPENISKKGRRKNEYIASRICLYYLFESRYGFRFIVRNNECGVPIWPLGYIGSISHSKTAAVVAVAKKEDTDVASIGIDLECFLDDFFIENNSFFVTGYELKYLKCLTSIGLKETLTISFSIKEAFYKAHAKEIMANVTFHDVSVIYISQGDIKLVLNRTIVGVGEKNDIFNAKYKFIRNSVLTLITVYKQRDISKY